MFSYSETEKLLLRTAKNIECVDTSNTSELWDLNKVSLTCFDDDDVSICDAFFKALCDLCPSFRPSDKNRYTHDKGVREWRSWFRRIPLRDGKYTVQRIIFRDPDYDASGEIGLEQNYQVDLIDSKSKKVRHVKGVSMLSLCTNTLLAAREMFCI